MYSKGGLWYWLSFRVSIYELALALDLKRYRIMIAQEKLFQSSKDRKLGLVLSGHEQSMKESYVRRDYIR